MQSMETRRNPEMTGLVVGLLLCGLGLGLFLVPFLFGMDGMNGGYALNTFGIFFLIAGVITTLMFGVRAGAVQKIFAGEGVIAHWIYTDENFVSAAKKERQEQQGSNRFLLLVVAVFIFACSILFSIYGYIDQGEFNLAVPAVLLGVLLIVSFFAFGMPEVTYRQALKSKREAYILKDGVFLFGAYHPWGRFGSSLEKVEYREKKAGPTLDFRISYPTRLGVFMMQSYTVAVPVPAGKELEAQQLVEQY